MVEREAAGSRQDAHRPRFGHRPRLHGDTSRVEGAQVGRQFRRAGRGFGLIHSFPQQPQKRLARLRAAGDGQIAQQRQTLGPHEVGVSKFGTFSVKRILYSAPSRLCGYRLKIRIYPERIEGWLGEACVLSTPRGRIESGKQRGKAVDYRHFLPTLKRKPGAFARWALRDAMFPREEYRRMWERLQEKLPERVACKTIIGLLDLAARGACEVDLAQVLSDLLAAGTLPDLSGLETRFAPRVGTLPAVAVELPSLASYDALLEGTA